MVFLPNKKEGSLGDIFRSCFAVLALVSLNCFASGVVITGKAVGDLVIGKAPPVLNTNRLVFRSWEIGENGQSYELLKVKVDGKVVSAEIYDGAIWRIRVDEANFRTRDGIKVGDRASVLIRRNPTVKSELGPGPSLVLIPTQPCGISYVTDAQLPDRVAFPLTSASVAGFAQAANIKTILVVGCEK